MRRIIVPLYPGLCSAFGALIADFKVDKILSQHFRSTEVKAESVERLFRKMVSAALAELRQEGFRGVPIGERSISMRYAGQNYEHDVKVKGRPITPRTLEAVFESFHRLHEQFYGYSISREVIELIRCNVSVVGPSKAPTLRYLPSGRISPPLHTRPVYFKGKGSTPCPVYGRASVPGKCELKGPAIIEEQDSTILLHPGNTLRVKSKGVITVTR